VDKAALVDMELADTAAAGTVFADSVVEEIDPKGTDPAVGTVAIADLAAAQTRELLHRKRQRSSPESMHIMFSRKLLPSLRLFCSIF
jgi:hypothetical protein